MPVASPRLRRAIGTTVAVVLLAAGLMAVQAEPAAAAAPVPPTRAGLTKSIEALQPYVGQATCDPVAKPGVRAFRDLLLRTYPDTGSFGIVRDCGAGGQSEHKEGRAFDWKVSAYNSRQKAEADALISWLLKTDQYGNSFANARRLGIMYMIWNKRIWKSYNPTWQAYSGPSPHTDHVHFSFGWNGAKKVTSYWDGSVAQIDFGPRLSPKITPVRTLSNLSVQRTYGSTSLGYGSSGSAVTFLQRKLQVEADGEYGSGTATAVAHFQVDQGLYPTQRWGRTEWKTLFPLPQAPIGRIDPPSFALGNLLVRGWALDLDTDAPVSVAAYVDGAHVQTVAADLYRSDVAKTYPEWGGNHGYLLTLPVVTPPDVDGSYEVCLTALNASGTPGVHTPLGCRTVSEEHSPVGALDGAATGLGTVTVRGWAVDPDTADTITTALTVDGVPSDVVPTVVSRPDVDLRIPGMGALHGIEAELDLPEGPHEVCLTGVNAAGTEGQDRVVGCRTVTAVHSPVGVVELARRAPGGALVKGWALDPDTTAPTTVEVLKDGQVLTSALASATTTRTAGTWPLHSSAHGFSATVPLSAGTHSLCVRVANADGTPGAATTLPCRTVSVSNQAVGAVKANRTTPTTGTVVVAGDAFDPDTLDPATVTVTVGGNAVTTVTADRASTTSASRWPGYGQYRGFAATLRLSPGLHYVCARVNNASGSPGTASTVGCRTVVVSRGVGAVTGWSLSGRTLTARGWALDPDTRATNRATLMVDGKAVKHVVADRYRSSLPRILPNYGTNHGFVATAALSRGRHKVCVASHNVAGTPGTWRVVSCTSLWVP